MLWIYFVVGTLIGGPGKKVGTISIVSSFGDDEFSEISFATLDDGELSDDFSNYYISDKWI